MNTLKRLNLASKVAQFFVKRDYPSNDGFWIVGMLCDTTISDEELGRHIADTKEKFPEYADLLEWDDKVYCVFSYPPIEGAEHPVLDKVFAQRVDAEKYMNEENKKAGWNMVTCVSEEKIC